ncbi:hypothetical protein [Microbacterium gorillae]|uniref:hypothetical protein n=1 Tax=Microbacterium gorillae TaxID=1231063 RepID=UPI0005908FE6|nr:hypothetical protein [Microbacterium gorillae]
MSDRDDFVIPGIFDAAEREREDLASVDVNGKRELDPDANEDLVESSDADRLAAENGEAED